MCFGEGKIGKTSSFCQKTCCHDYGSALKSVAKLDRNIVLSHSDCIDKFIIDLLTHLAIYGNWKINGNL